MATCFIFFEVPLQGTVGGYRISRGGASLAPGYGEAAPSGRLERTRVRATELVGRGTSVDGRPPGRVLRLATGSPSRPCAASVDARPWPSFPL